MFQNNQTPRSDDRKEDKPPYSRVFVVCSKQTQEDDLRAPFEQYGEIDDIYMPRDRHSGESKGVAYIKFAKTTSAAAAIRDFQAKPLKINNKPIKVMVASANKNDSNSTNEERYKRLFIKVHKDVADSEIHNHFSNFGDVDSVYLQKDKSTDKCKGFAYVHFTNFYDTAKAYEECDRKYKPVFATPKDELKRPRRSLDGIFGSHDYPFSGSNHVNHYVKDSSYMDSSQMLKDSGQKMEICTLPSSLGAQDYDTIVVTCSPHIPQKYIEPLFNIVPGMIQFNYSIDSYNGVGKALVTYNSQKWAAYAMERINNYEFPSGELISVKPDVNPLNKAANNLSSIVNNFKNSIEAGSPDLLQLADAIAQASTLIKAATSAAKIEKKSLPSDSQENYCNVILPPPQPLSNSSRVAQRCFIVCKPYPPPAAALRDAFCRFGDLIDVCTFPNKTFGFVKFASIKSAQEAIKTLHGAILCGVQLKVLEADERPSKDCEQNLNDHESKYGSMDHDNSRESKRIKLCDDSRNHK